MIMSKNETFLYFYFYYLEELLQQRKSELGRIKFQSEEANTDEFIKRYLKDVILENPGATLFSYIYFCKQYILRGDELAGVQSYYQQ